jgi:transcription elongation factor Elf1
MESVTKARLKKFICKHCGNKFLVKCKAEYIDAVPNVMDGWIERRLVHSSIECDTCGYPLDIHSEKDWNKYAKRLRPIREKTNGTTKAS